MYAHILILYTRLQTRVIRQY